MCFAEADQAVAVCEAIVKVEDRDYGNREDRKVARLKYFDCQSWIGLVQSQGRGVLRKTVNPRAIRKTCEVSMTTWVGTSKATAGGLRTEYRKRPDQG